MGNLEKAGVGVVVALLLVIMIVAFTTEPDAGVQQGTEPREGEPRTEARLSGRAADSRESDSEFVNPSVAGVAPEEGPQDGMRRLDVRDVQPTPPIRGAGTDGGLSDGGVDIDSLEERVASPTMKTNGAQRTDTAPTTGSASPAGSKPGNAPNSEWPKTVVARDGDSLWTLAKRTYGSNRLAAVMTKPIMRANGLKNDRIKKGAKLKLPAPPASVATASAAGKAGRDERPASASGGSARRTPGKRDAARATLPWEPSPAVYTKATVSGGRTGDGYYIVKKNDSLSQIAESELGSSKRVPELMKLNGIKNKNKISVGMRLKLPAKK